MKNSMKQETIIHFESMWMHGLALNKGAKWSPSDSVSPFLSAICSQWESNYIYRQIHSLEDLLIWSKAAAESNKTHSKILWLSGHGGKKRAFRFSRGDENIEKDISEIFKAIRQAGELTGIVIDSCSFGMHLRRYGSIPHNTKWVLASDNVIDFIGSSFVFAKAIYWITSGESRSALKNFMAGMETDHEDKVIEQADYTSLVTSMGIRLYWLEGSTLCTYPDVDC